MTTRAQAKLMLPLLVLLIASAVYYSLVNSKSQREKPALSEKVWQIEVIRAEQQVLSPSVRLYGRIESPELLKAAAPGGSIVEKVFVRNGASVKQGQPLVTLDRRDFAASLLQAEADLRDLDNQIAELKIRYQSNLASLDTERELLALANDEVRRLLELKKQNLSADTALNSARSELGRRSLEVTARELEVESYPAKLQILIARQDHARAELDQARLAMTRSEIQAPFDAIISEVVVAAGDRVSLGQVLISLFPINSLEIRAHLPINYVKSVQRAIADGIKLDARVTNRAELGHFPLLRLAGEAEATGIDVYFAVESNAEQLRPGELLPVSLKLPAVSGVFAVPYQAIYGNSRIYRVVEDRLQALDVTTVGQSSDEDRQVLVLIRSEEIESGDLIAVTHLPNSVSGLKVKIDGH
ncbi:MAG: biotin/lipoyl-binding protein [Gammaproteobacteria bacterium]|nr:biotin/lipoyl-binding protein [Gammaproteobacteria bacterium]